MDRNIAMTIMAAIIVVLIGTNVYSYVGSPAINESADLALSSIGGLLKPQERQSPHDWIKEEQIHVYDNKVVIDVKNPEWASFSDTNSMDPLLDMGANAIEIIPQSEEDIHVGDVVSYESEYADGTIIHRVVEIGKDSKGTYFILKGDNNPDADPGRVRFHQIKRILVAVIY